MGLYSQRGGRATSEMRELCEGVCGDLLNLWHRKMPDESEMQFDKYGSLAGTARLLMNKVPLYMQVGGLLARVGAIQG